MTDDAAQGASTASSTASATSIIQLAGVGDRGHPRGRRRCCSTATWRAPTTSSTATTRSTRARSSSRSAATTCSPCRQPWPATCARSIAAVKMISEIERSGDLVRQRLQGGPPHLRHRARPRAARPHRADERAGPPACSGLAIDAYAEGDAALAAALDDMDDRLDQLHDDSSRPIFEMPRRRADRPAGRRAARARRPLLRAHRRPRRQHRRAGPLHGHRLAPEPRPRSGRLRAQTPIDRELGEVFRAQPTKQVQSADVVGDFVQASSPRRGPCARHRGSREQTRPRAWRASRRAAGRGHRDDGPQRQRSRTWARRASPPPAPPAGRCRTCRSRRRQRGSTTRRPVRPMQREPTACRHLRPNHAGRGCRGAGPRTVAASHLESATRGELEKLVSRPVHDRPRPGPSGGDEVDDVVHHLVEGIASGAR